MRKRLWAVLALFAGFAGVGASPAAAADPLLFSLDGQAWDSELVEPLFGEAVTLVPGDELSTSFWVRNASSDPADLKVALVADWAAAGDDLWVRAAVNGAATSGTGDQMLLTVEGMGARDSRVVTVTVGLDAEAGNNTQNLTQPMAFDVRLTQSIPQAPAPGDGDGVIHPGNPVSPTPSTGSDVPAQPNVPAVPGESREQPKAGSGAPFGALPDTGFTALWVAVAGAALTAGGFLAVAYSRKKNITSEEGSHGSA